MQDAPYDVVILGCGPTGVVLANLLGELGCRVAVLEREPEVHPIPRATHVDEETLRNFQATGLMPALLGHTTLVGKIEVVDEDGSVLLADEVGDPAASHGYTGSRFFDQPAFERILREGLRRFPTVRLELGAEVVGIAELGDGVTVTARRGDGEAMVLRAAWVVGCDGGRSVTRAAIGAEMESLAPRKHWLIVDTLLNDTADAARLPDRFRYLLERERLTLYAHGIGRNRRWEFQLGDDEATPDEATVRGWIGRFIEPERLTITRIAKYAHNSLLAARWRAGRILIAGDAAHMMPPTAGQGMCAGIRDAINLAWKLHAVVSGRAAPGLLDSYERERRPHVHEVLAGTLFMSERLQASTGLQRWRRRNELRLVGSLPPVRSLLRHLGLRHPPLREGCLDAGSPGRGQHLPQVRVRHEGREVLLDEVLGYRFALVVRAEVLTTRDLDWAAAQGVRVLRPGADFVEVEGQLARFMRKQELDFVLVRPDRQIFGAGAARELPRVEAALTARLAGAAA